MNKRNFKRFKELYLTKFKKYYREDNAEQRKKLKSSIYDNPKISEEQKDEFWTLVKEK